MQTVRLNPNAGEPPLHTFLRKNLPKQFEVVHRSDGYGCSYYVLLEGHLVAVVEEPLQGLLRFLFGRDYTSGRAYTDVLELKQPQFFSDIEDAIRKYEETSGGWVLFKYWQAD